MKIRFLAIAALGLLLGTTACGSETHDGTASASTSSPSASSSTPTSATTSTTAPTAAAEVSTTPPSAASAPTPATSSNAPATGQLAPSVPQQTLTTLPSDSFTVTYRGSTYYCEPAGLFSRERNDCVRYYGGSAPYVGNPELYCSRSSFSSPECSEDWYPAELEDADLVSMGGQTYVCRSAFLGGSFGDKDCARYSGGDPDNVSYSMALKCSPDLGSLQCDDQYYPSEMKGLTEVRIGYTKYLCKSTWQGRECWEWSYGSPKSATMGWADLYCNSSGTCAEDGYPRSY